MRTRTCLFALVLVVGNSDVYAQTRAPLTDHPRVQEAIHLLDTWLQWQLAYEDIPGISAGVVLDQDLVWSAGYGFADVERRAPATAQTIYSICSISKLFTSIAVLQLRDAGRLRLDDPVGKHLPWFDIEESFAGGAPVRIEGLLTHSSGLPRESAFPYWSGPDFRFPSRDEVRATVAEQAALYPSERWYQYSNLGLTLAGEVVAAVSGRPYDEYVKENILAPLGLVHTTPEIPAAEKGRLLATGYGRRMPGAHRDVIPFYTVNGIAPAAGFASSVEDLARFASWQFRLLEKGGAEVLDANTLREMQRVHWMDPDLASPRGLGFGIWRDGEDTFVGHGGSCPGYQTQLALHTKDRIATIAMVNAMGVSASALATRAYRIMAPALKAATDTAASAQPAPVDPELEPYLGTYRSAWGDAAVLRWEGGLALVSLPTDDPLEGMTRLRRTGPHTFVRVRRGEDIPGEMIVFEVGADGQAVRMLRNSQIMERLR